MRNNKVVKGIGLSLAVVTAAAMMLSNVAPVYANAANSFNLTARSFLMEIRQTIKAGDIKAALAMIAHLREMGVTSISLDGVLVSMDDLEGLVRDGSTQAVATLIEYANIAVTQRVRFEVSANEVASVLTQRDVFPISSAG